MLVVAATIGIAPRALERSRAELVEIAASYPGVHETSSCEGRLGFAVARLTSSFQGQATISLGIDGRPFYLPFPAHGYVVSAPGGGILHAKWRQDPDLAWHMFVVEIGRDGTASPFGEIKETRLGNFIERRVGSTTTFFAISDELFIVRTVSDEKAVRRSFTADEVRHFERPPSSFLRLLVHHRKEAILHALTWLSGIFPDGRRPAELDRRDVRDRIDELCASDDPWIREAAILARDR